MNLFFNQSISFRIALHCAWILFLTGIAFLAILAVNGTVSMNPDLLAKASSIDAVPMAAGNPITFILNWQNALWFCGLLLIASLALGFMVHFQLGKLRQLASAAERLLNSRVENTKPLPLTGTLETDRLSQSYNEMRGQIESLLRNLREMMDHIAHDILTPVTRLRGHAEIQLHRPENPPQILETCGHTVEECDAILNLVNSILKLAAVESGLKVWQFEPLDLVGLIRDGCELFTPVIDDNLQTLTIDLPPKCMIRGDRAAIQRMIANFLDNAIKYTPSGGHLKVSLKQTNQEVRLNFTDNGVGIDEKEHLLIFQRFYRGDQSRSKPGHGLGLSFCFFVVRAMGGHIHIKSEREQGATFTVTIPRAQKRGQAA